MQVNIDMDDLLKWARAFETIPERTPAVIAAALNTAGENITRQAVNFISENTGLDPSEVANMIYVKDATPQDLSFEIDASRIAPPSMDWSRPFPTRDDITVQQPSTFDQQALVKIVSAGDELVCEVCEQLEENSPYTMEEVQRLIPAHPNCRCLIQAWQVTRRLPVVFGQSGATPTFMSVRQIGEAIAGEVATSIKAIG